MFVCLCVCLSLARARGHRPTSNHRIYDSSTTFAAVLLQPDRIRLSLVNSATYKCNEDMFRNSPVENMEMASFLFMCYSELRMNECCCCLKYGLFALKFLNLDVTPMLLLSKIWLVRIQVLDVTPPCEISAGSFSELHAGDHF